MSVNKYPDNWWEIAYSRKCDVDFTCERCGHPHDPDNGYTLTVHHLNGNPADCRKANLAVLCQRCHLHVQAVPFVCLVNQLEMFDDFELRWLRPHLEGLGLTVPAVPVGSRRTPGQPDGVALTG